jgi:hypothetical protein
MKKMRAPYIATRTALGRRSFLRGAGVALALPFLDSMTPAFAQTQNSSSPLAPGARPVRFSDRAQIDQIVDATKSSQYASRDIVHQTFRNK